MLDNQTTSRYRSFKFIIFIAVFICLLPNLNIGILYDIQFLTNSIITIVIYFCIKNDLRVSKNFSSFLIYSFILIGYCLITALFVSEPYLAFKELSFYILFFLTITSFSFLIRIEEAKNDLLVFIRSFSRCYILILALVCIYSLPYHNTYVIQKLIGENVNYLSSYSLVLLPVSFLKLENKKDHYILKYFCAIATIITILICNSKGVLIAAVLVYIFSKFPKYRFYILSLIIVSLLVLSYYIDINFLNQLLPTQYIDRIYMIKSSLSAFTENIYGVGLGNWKNFVFTEDTSSVKSLSYPYLFKIYSSHNLSSKILLELGILGSIMVLNLLFVIRNLFSNLIFTKVKSVLIYSTLIFIILSEFYSSLIYNGSRYISVYFLVAIVIGILVSDSYNRELKVNINFKVVFVIISAFSLGFSLFHAVNRNLYFNSTKVVDTVRVVSNLNNVELLYNINGVSTIENQNIAFLLAMKYADNLDTTSAREYFIKAININPNSKSILYEYAKFEFQQKNLLQALKFAELAFSMQSTNGFLNTLLIEINIALEKPQEAKYYLKHLKISSELYGGSRFKTVYLKYNSLLN